MWIIIKEASVRQFWRKLSKRKPVEQAAYENAERVLAAQPYPPGDPPTAIKHLKADFHCSHEYRKLPDGQRICYKILTRQDFKDAAAKNAKLSVEEPDWQSDDELGVVLFWYAGPHL